MLDLSFPAGPVRSVDVTFAVVAMFFAAMLLVLMVGCSVCRSRIADDQADHLVDDERRIR